MKYIQEFREGDHVAGIYLCKQKNSAVTKNGKPYDNVILQDKTGSIDCKIWDVGSAGICDFDALDYVDIVVIVEKNFGFKITNPSEMSAVKTLTQFYDYIESKMS